MKLYSYWRSTAAYRVRIALNIKGQGAEIIPVHLVRNGGEQNAEWYLQINPQGRVPALVIDDGSVILQSGAIIEYLEERFPEPSLLGADSRQRAMNRAIAGIIGSDIHPINNVAVLNRLRAEGLSEDQIKTWVAFWIQSGFAAIEALIGDEGFCYGDRPGLADLFLIPQLYSAGRFRVSTVSFPRIERVAALAEAHPAFTAAHPANQVDAE